MKLWPCFEGWHGHVLVKDAFFYFFFIMLALHIAVIIIIIIIIIVLVLSALYPIFLFLHNSWNPLIVKIWGTVTKRWPLWFIEWWIMLICIQFDLLLSTSSSMPTRTMGSRHRWWISTVWQTIPNTGGSEEKPWVCKGSLLEGNTTKPSEAASIYATTFKEETISKKPIDYNRWDKVKENVDHVKMLNYKIMSSI